MLRPRATNDCPLAVTTENPCSKLFRYQGTFPMTWRRRDKEPFDIASLNLLERVRNNPQVPGAILGCGSRINVLAEGDKVLLGQLPASPGQRSPTLQRR